ncbi:uncharacterized protein EDB93DRAFT_1246158 [Suillus bovinus]|uniref:uncharacterized protein n=1 Tax=Suillus bovinus TaxID=48563 RepID=UPI001B86C7B7|nr:uncharacterized protein EDB93DRAFT_1246158 [Suillus bovinus]KAG2158306.1 hypothetical protein EDB93DRAFT_1246158 [Suillus bovinus]
MEDAGARIQRQRAYTSRILPHARPGLRNPPGLGAVATRRLLAHALLVYDSANEVLRTRPRTTLIPPDVYFFRQYTRPPYCTYEKLSAGELTPEVARDWDNACTTYFMHKKIDAKDQVKMIAFGMLDPRLRTWYLTQRATLDGGTFTQYMTALKNAWLESHWDTKLRRKVLGSQQGNRPFYEWALELQNQNALLYGSTTHLTDAQLRNQLEANICEELTIPVLRANLADNLTLKAWIEEVKYLDDKRLEDLAAHRKIAEDLYKSSRRAAPTSAHRLLAWVH